MHSLLLLASLLATLPGPDDTSDLPPGEVARVDDRPVPLDEFHEYLGRSYARLPEGNAALQQLLVETLVHRAATERDIEVTDEDVDALMQRLDARASASDGDDRSLEERLTDPSRAEELRRAIRLLALQERIVRVELALPADETPDDAQLQGWLATQMAAARLTERPLDDPLAADWAHGSLPRSAVGRLLHRTLGDEAVSGRLTELLGIRLIEGRAQATGVRFLPEVVEAELAERERAVRANPQTKDLSYEQILAQVEKRSVDELVASDRFRAEILLRQLTEREWDEVRLRQLYESEPTRFGTGNFDGTRPLLWREARQRTYQGLFRESTIVRRF